MSSKINRIIKKMNSYSDTKCICGSSDCKRIFAGNFNRNGPKDYYFQILKCKNCGLARTHPALDINKAREDAVYSFCDNIALEEKDNVWAKTIAQTAKKYVSSGNVLDIGCYAGKLLEEVEKEGFKAYGIELYSHAAEYGRKKGRNIFSGEVYDARFEDGFFSCVVVNHVFEHIQEPVKFIKEINRILKSNGILIINLPTHDSLMRIIMGRNWLQWTPYVHAFFYTQKTLNDTITQNSGFEPVFIHQKGRLEPPTDNWFKNKLKDFIANFASLINKGEQIEAIYRKAQPAGGLKF
ncbi:MAG: class I SAM-dependent methyltransferase [Candidatus Omnitrophota bacterium]